MCMCFPHPSTTPVVMCVGGKRGSAPQARAGRAANTRLAQIPPPEAARVARAAMYPSRARAPVTRRSLCALRPRAWWHGAPRRTHGAQSGTRTLGVGVKAMRARVRRRSGSAARQVRPVLALVSHFGRAGARHPPAAAPRTGGGAPLPRLGLILLHAACQPPPGPAAPCVAPARRDKGCCGRQLRPRARALAPRTSRGGGGARGARGARGGGGQPPATVRGERHDWFPRRRCLGGTGPLGREHTLGWE